MMTRAPAGDSIGASPTVVPSDLPVRSQTDVGSPETGDGQIGIVEPQGHSRVTPLRSRPCRPLQQQGGRGGLRSTPPWSFSRRVSDSLDRCGYGNTGCPKRIVTNMTPYIHANRRVSTPPSLVKPRLLPIRLEGHMAFVRHGHIRLSGDPPIDVENFTVADPGVTGPAPPEEFAEFTFRHGALVAGMLEPGSDIRQVCSEASLFPLENSRHDWEPSPGSAQVCAFRLDSLRPGSGQVHPNQGRVRQVGIRQVGQRRRGSPEPRSGQIRPARVALEQRRSVRKCAAQIRAESIGLSQERPEWSRTGELRVPEIRTQQIRLPEIKAGQVATASIRASQVAMRPIRALPHSVCGRAYRQEQQQSEDSLFARNLR